MVKINRSQHRSSRFLLHLVLQPKSEYSSFCVLDISQHVVSRDGPCTLRCLAHDHLFVQPIDVQHSHPCSGSVMLCWLAREVAEIGRHSHDHLFVQLVHVLRHHWIHDVSQPDLSHDGPYILRCLALGRVEIGKHSHDRVVFLEHDGQGIFLGLVVVLDLVVVARAGPPECC